MGFCIFVCVLCFFLCASSAKSLDNIAVQPSNFKVKNIDVTKPHLKSDCLPSLHL